MLFQTRYNRQERTGEINSGKTLLKGQDTSLRKFRLKI